MNRMNDLVLMEGKNNLGQMKAESKGSLAAKYNSSYWTLNGPEPATSKWKNMDCKNRKKFHFCKIFSC